MVIEKLKKAFAVTTPVILNSYQGCQFTSTSYVEFLKENKVKISMDGKSRWADNIMIERWFRTLKYDEVYLNHYQNIREAMKQIGDFFTITIFKNHIHPWITKHQQAYIIRHNCKRMKRLHKV